MPTDISALASDGPLPEHYEPIESPAINTFHPKVQINPVAIVRETLKDIQKVGKSDQFPYILTTNRGGAAHFCSGAVTRNIDWLNELAPEAYLELDTVLAGKLGIKYGEMIEVASARGAVRLKAVVTDRIQPLTINGKQTHVVNAPYGWGFTGLATGPSINALTISAMDPAGGTPEYKACLCDIRKVK
jgi:formate dehydrogenase major subunit